MICADGAPCYDITIEDFAMWTESGSKQWYSCESAYGSGFCLKNSGSHTSYAVTTTTVSSAPSGYSAAKMASDLSAAFGTASSIPIPAIPTSYYPGAAQISKLSGSATVQGVAKIVSTGSAAAAVAATAASSTAEALGVSTLLATSSSVSASSVTSAPASTLATSTVADSASPTSVAASASTSASSRKGRKGRHGKSRGGPAAC